MIKLSVFYPSGPGAKFDMDYYVKKHMPMVRQKLGAICKGTNAELGIAGGGPGAPPTYIAIGHVLCDSVEALQAAMAPHEKEIMGDIPNYTNITPIIQISTVTL
jgi:uncharacterized protein (TIGR02118 family)